MEKKKINNIKEKFFIFITIIIFFSLNFNRADYGLPFFINLDEVNFQYSTLSYLSFFTGYLKIIDPIYAPLLNLIIILKLIFINEFLINTLSPELIKWKIYFNPELLIYYGRLSSLVISSISIFFLYLIFKKLKINFYIYSFLILSFSTSLVLLDVAIVNGKHSYFLLFFLIQLYFFFKYLIKIHNFNLKSYIIFGFLGSLAWGVSYWPAFISIYAVFILHFRKYKFTKFNYLITFILTFILFGPIIGILYSDYPILDFIFTPNEINNFEFESFYKSTTKDFFEGLKIIFFAEKNLLLLALLSPFFLYNKNTKYKKEFLIILIIFLEPIILFAVSQKAFPQLRYFAGNACVILILTSIIFNHYYNSKLRFLFIIFIAFNSYIIYNNLNNNIKINNIITNKHQFYNFDESIKIDKKKILYLVDLRFQESLKQNELYLRLIEKNLIKKTKDYEIQISRIKDKIKNTKNKKEILINDKNLKKDINYFNYTYFEISDLNQFFEYVKNDFDYVLIEETKPFYLSHQSKNEKIKKFIKKNFLLQKTHIKEDLIYLRSLRSIIHYYANATNRFDDAQNIDNKNMKVTFGSNYSLYKIN